MTDYDRDQLREHVQAAVSLVLETLTEEGAMDTELTAFSMNLEEWATNEVMRAVVAALELQEERDRLAPKP